MILRLSLEADIDFCILSSHWWLLSFLNKKMGGYMKGKRDGDRGEGQKRTNDCACVEYALKVREKTTHTVPMVSTRWSTSLRTVDTILTVCD